MSLKHFSAILFSGMLLIGMISCDSNSDCCTIIDTNIDILYKNASGENLINSNSDFDESKIRVYYKNGNDFEYVYDGNLTYPNNYRISEDEHANIILTIFPSYFYEGIQSTTLIELNPNVVDTLVCEFELDTNKEICKRAWLNGVEMIDRFLEVEK